MNSLKICEVCGRVLQEKVKQPDRVVIIVKVICEKCNKENGNKQQTEQRPCKC